MAPCAAEATTARIIEEACRKAASGVSYDHCVSSLVSDAQSCRDAADTHNLAVLAAKIAVEHAGKIEDRSEVEGSPHARVRLHHCLELYNAATDILPHI